MRCSMADMWISDNTDDAGYRGAESVIPTGQGTGGLILVEKLTPVYLRALTSLYG